VAVVLKGPLALQSCKAAIVPAGAEAGDKDARINATIILCVTRYTPMDTYYHPCTLTSFFRKLVVKVPPMIKATKASVKLTILFIV
jgi:hypothetical protein